MYLTEKYKTPISPAQAKSYEESLKHYRDLKNSLDTAHDEGYEEGVEAGIIKTNIRAIKKLHNSEFSAQQISDFLELDINFVKDVLSKLN